MADAVPPAPQDKRAVRRAHHTLLLIAAVCMAPIVASYMIYYFFPQEPTANHGALLPAAPAPAIAGVTREGAPFALADLHGRWAVVIVSTGGCEIACGRGLYATRQARTMQGREQERVMRVLLVADGAPPRQELLAEHPGLVVARVASAALVALPGGPAGIFIVDPLGNLVLRYPEDPDIKGLAGDLARLLRASRIG
jgi:hypothetical protein